MINNIQFTGNPVQIGKKGIKVATDAMDSFAASRQNISRLTNADKLAQQTADASAAFSKKPIAIPVNEKMKEAPKLHDTMLQRADSYAISHGTPEEQLAKGGIDYLA